MVPPLTIPGAKPVTAVPALTPRSPVMEVGPIFVTVDPASTAKVEAAPSETEAWLTLDDDDEDDEELTDEVLEDNEEDEDELR
jgi:hypothetical protein